MTGKGAKKSKVAGDDIAAYVSESEAAASAIVSEGKQPEGAMGSGDLSAERASLNETYVVDSPVLGPERFVTSTPVVPLVRPSPQPPTLSVSSEEAEHGLSTDTSVENALHEAVSELHNASDENDSPSTAETVSDHAPSPTPADNPQQSTPSGKTTGTSETVNDHAPPSPTPADESQQSTSSGKTTGDSSSSSAIVALLAASVYVESRILTQEEARNLLKEGSPRQEV